MQQNMIFLLIQLFVSFIVALPQAGPPAGTTDEDNIVTVWTVVTDTFTVASNVNGHRKHRSSSSLTSVSFFTSVGPALNSLAPDCPDSATEGWASTGCLITSYPEGVNSTSMQYNMSTSTLNVLPRPPLASFTNETTTTKVGTPVTFNPNTTTATKDVHVITSSPISSSFNTATCTVKWCVSGTELVSKGHIILEKPTADM
ncbi:hypothetical protein F5Y16DRAFT_398963 [Xylariaceae sp. FL0255]|nr:hypothetical protein F5Y16DRAFT_398963 [Xylariaceae sp. FL0255]